MGYNECMKKAPRLLEQSERRSLQSERTTPVTARFYTEFQITTAMRLAESAHLWPRGRSKADGQRFFVIPSQTDMHRAHWTTALGCTCLGFEKRGVCSHQLACLLVQQREDAAMAAEHEARRAREFQERVNVAPAPRKGYADLFPEGDFDF